MRVAYLVPEAVAPASGVGRKVADQLRAWRRLGATGRLFVLQRPGVPSWAAVEPDACEETFARRHGRLVSEVGRQAALARLAAAVVEWQPDIVYARFGPWSRGARRLFARLPVVVEVNADDVAEYRLGPPLLSAYNRLTRRRVLGRAAGLVFPTVELADRPAMATTRGHRTVIPNGIDLERWAVTAPPTNERPRLVLVAGSAGTWQGVDKAVRLAAALPDVDVQIVGRDGPEGVPRSGGEGRGRPANVAYLGTLEGDAYRAALAGADAGLGPLALHRKGMDAACPLKVREYLAAGLPVVAAYSDDDLPDDADFVLRIPNTEDNVERHAGEVREFVAAWRGRRVSRDAVAHLDQACKEQERLAFFGGVLGAGG